jgi:hypothetical protein
MTFEVFRNPTKGDVSKLLKKNPGGLRAAIDDVEGDVYVWGGEEVLHNAVLSQLNLPGGYAAGQVLEPRDLDRLYAQARPGGRNGPLGIGPSLKCALAGSRRPQLPVPP